MFQPNLDCTIQRSGAVDLYGNNALLPAVHSRCSVVKLLQREVNVTVRADSSASRGFAQEIVVDSVLLFLPSTEIKINDVVTVFGVSVIIVGLFPRHDVRGRLDHLQAEGMRWK